MNTPGSWDPSQPIRVAGVLESFEQLWSPRILAQVNDYDVRVAKVKGEFVWHRHADTDEFFLVLGGSLSIDVRDGGADAESRTVELPTGSVFTVPRGVEHKPWSLNGASILMFELTGTLNTGATTEALPEHLESTTGHRL